MFRAGFAIGLKPEEVLDMTYEELVICHKAYSDRKKLEYESQLQLAILNAYYSGYYAPSAKKHKTSPGKVIQSLLKPNAGDKKNEIDPELVFRRQEEKWRQAGK